VSRAKKLSSNAKSVPRNTLTCGPLPRPAPVRISAPPAPATEATLTPAAKGRLVSEKAGQGRYALRLDLESRDVGPAARAAPVMKAAFPVPWRSPAATKIPAAEVGL